MYILRTKLLERELDDVNNWNCSLRRDAVLIRVVHKLHMCLDPVSLLVFGEAHDVNSTRPTEARGKGGRRGEEDRRPQNTTNEAPPTAYNKGVGHNL